MRAKVYSIKEVANILDIESYVLRYYEKELDLQIHRNAQGHRIYEERDIDILRQIKDLREQGLELKAIRNALHTQEDDGMETLIQIGGIVNKVSTTGEKENHFDITDMGNEKVQQFSIMMKEMLKQALVEYNGDTKEQLKEELSEEMTYMVNKKMKELEVAQTQKDEEYYSKIDETMREMQKLRREIAEIEGSKQKISVWKKWFKNKDKEIEQIQEKSM